MKILRFYILFLMLINIDKSEGFFLSASAQSRMTISGFVEDVENGEKLIGASLYAAAHKIGTISNRYGFFSLSLPKQDSLTLTVSYVGYKTQLLRIAVPKDLKLNVALHAETTQEAIEVTAARTPITESSQTSTIEIPIQQVKTMPALLGEVDVIKALQLLPGVQSGSEGSSGLYVRGGGPDQNLILLDDTPIYNVSHLFGFFSVFNADAIQHVSLSKGGFPARYGGRLSSVVDITLKEGNLREPETEGSVGLVAAKIAQQGPIIKDRVSYFISARRTYIDVLSRPFMDKIFPSENQNLSATTGYFFYDVNGKVNAILSAKDRVCLSYYGGKDRFYLDQKELYNQQRNTYQLRLGMDWGNTAAALRWNHLFSPRLFSNLVFSYSRYGLSADFEEGFIETFPTPKQNISKAKYNSGIRDWRGKWDFDWSPNPQHALKFGALAVHHTFKPAAAQVTLQSQSTNPTETAFSPQEAETPAWEAALYVEDDLQISSRLKANVGLHAAGYWVDGVFFKSIQPRISARFKWGAYAAKASAVWVQQPLHLLTTSSIGLPTDLWLPATKKVPPESAYQVALSLVRAFAGFEASIEGYYKRMQNVVEYKVGANFLNDPSKNWQEKVVQGEGEAYGLELFFQKTTGRLTGWLGYTLAWSKRHFTMLNDGRPFPYRYDRRHDVVNLVSFRASDRVTISGTWVYGTGNALSLPLGRMVSADRPWENEALLIYSTRNGYRMPAYHRLDLGINFKKIKAYRWFGKGERTWSFSAYNAYNQKNAFFIYQGKDPQTGATTFRQASLFPVIPSVAYSFKF